jgi:hypothetical protein
VAMSKASRAKARPLSPSKAVTAVS